MLERMSHSHLGGSKEERGRRAARRPHKSGFRNTHPGERHRNKLCSCGPFSKEVNWATKTQNQGEQLKIFSIKGMFFSVLSDFKATAGKTGQSLKKFVQRSSCSEREEAGKLKPGEKFTMTIKNDRGRC